MKKPGIFLFSLLTFFLLHGCSGSDSTAPPGISVTSTNVARIDGTPGIQFFAKSNMDIQLIKVVIIDPLGEDYEYNFHNIVTIEGETVPLQAQDIAYRRISGNWTFIFTGSKTGGDRSTFEVTAVVDVVA
ncbi:hypothetical protein QA601_15425 [Chitinispirillales bacterium ANBcel5]|uniref:hypothetical protein n=1 Tax=Cellulosispirillum alkaliphilum TaxID=3039283 RepID=UPI002A4EF574|nr:hypothetical protein [Chitinispirillales bacterium ANBcel5]